MSDPSTSPGIVAGWYPDPAGRFELRYHNGSAWTADVSTDGDRYIDPAGTAPSSRPPRAADRPGNGPAVAALVLGIASIALGWVPYIVAGAAVAAVLAVVFGFVGRARSKVTGRRSGFATAGIITGFIGMLVCVGGVVLTVVFARAIDRYTNPQPSTTEIEECGVVGAMATVQGRITNLGDETGDYSIRIGFVRPGTDNADRRGRVSVEGVPPGGSAPFALSRPISLDDVDCVVERVDGPLPFGVEVEN